MVDPVFMPEMSRKFVIIYCEVLDILYVIAQISREEFKIHLLAAVDNFVSIPPIQVQSIELKIEPCRRGRVSASPGELK
jgi:hypothetical protein